MKIIAPKEIRQSPEKAYAWINQTFFNPGAGYFGDWRMEYAEYTGLLQVKTRKGDRFIENFPSYVYHISYNFCGLRREVQVASISKGCDHVIHNRSIYGAIYHDVENYLSSNGLIDFCYYGYSPH